MKVLIFIIGLMIGGSVGYIMAALFDILSKDNEEDD